MEQMTPEIQQLKEDIDILQMKLQKLEEAEKQQPKTLLDAIRNLGYSVDACYEIIDAVEDFYETVDDELQELEETEQSLKEAFREAQQTEEWKELQRQIDEEDNNKNFKNSLDLIKEWGEQNKPPTLRELLMEWWSSDWGDQIGDVIIDDLIDLIDDQFIPPSHNTNSYQWNKCLEHMRKKLR